MFMAISQMAWCLHHGHLQKSVYRTLWAQGLFSVGYITMILIHKVAIMMNANAMLTLHPV